MRDSRLCDSFFEADGFGVYKQVPGGWKKTRHETFVRVEPAAPAVLRERVKTLLPLISDCRVVAAGQLQGIPFSVFDLAGYKIFTIDCLEDSSLDGIAADLQLEEDDLAQTALALADAQPRQTEIPGIYHLDLVAIQTLHPDISSKQAMTEFLNSTPFLELRLHCRHLPPWLETRTELEIEILDGGETISAVIRKKVCAT
jgi:hypothetical protein